MSFAADYRVDSLRKVIPLAQNLLDVNGASCVTKNWSTSWAYKIRALKQSLLKLSDLKKAA